MTGAGTTRVVVLGLGAMGLPMIRRLATTCVVTGFDVDASRRKLASADGLRTWETAAEAAAGAQVAVVAVRTLEQADGCLIGADGALAALAPGAVVVLTSTIGSAGAEALASKLALHGVLLLDAPVSGGPIRAGNGDLLALVSGSEQALAVARPALDAMVSTLVVVGSNPGEGQSMKIVNQLLCGVHIAAAAEALVLAQGLGIEPAAALEALGAGAAASFMLGDRGPRIAQQLAGESPEVLSRLDIFVKDMTLVTEAAAGVGVQLSVANAVRELFVSGERRGLAATDDSGVSLVVAGVELAQPA